MISCSFLAIVADCYHYISLLLLLVLLSLLLLLLVLVTVITIIMSIIVVCVASYHGYRLNIAAGMVPIDVW